MVTQAAIINALKRVKYPGFSRDIVSFGLIKNVTVGNDGKVSVVVELPSPNAEVAERIKSACGAEIQTLPGVSGAHVDVRQSVGGGPSPAGDPWLNRAAAPGIRHIVAVASGKGGVGKSTCAANLACALRHLGGRVGLLDCDIYGPSIPLMMGVHRRPTISEGEKMVPPENHGVKLMSMGFLVEGDIPVIWRGPMIVKTIQQFFSAVEWGELDFMIVDLPPGTGDAQLTLCQTVTLGGGVIVTTPQEASLGVVRKGIAMFEKVNVPILGIIENMSYFTAPSGERLDIFGHGGGLAEAERRGVPFLGEIPIFPEIRVGGDQGLPVVVSAPTAPPGRAFIRIAETLCTRLS
jgi:ATP-binding protein involved in chromosome partitioning